VQICFMLSIIGEQKPFVPKPKLKQVETLHSSLQKKNPPMYALVGKVTMNSLNFQLVFHGCTVSLPASQRGAI